MANKRPLTLEKFREIYSQVTRLCVELVIRTPGGVVLTLRSLPSWHGKWHLPGGTVLYGERITDAIKRIANEELGASVIVDKLMGYIEYAEEKERGFGWGISMVFLCSSTGSEMRPNEDASETGIFSKLPGNLIKEQRAFLKPMWDKIKRK